MKPKEEPNVGADHIQIIVAHYLIRLFEAVDQLSQICTGHLHVFGDRIMQRSD